jgi:hypothetical protein
MTWVMTSGTHKYDRYDDILWAFKMKNIKPVTPVTIRKIKE